MNFKKILSIATSLTLSAMLLVGCSNDSTKETTEKSYKIGLVTGQVGIEDKSFNQSALEGLYKAKNNLGVKLDISYKEPGSIANYGPKLEEYAQEGADLILGSGFPFAEPMVEVAKKYPDIQFVLIDATPTEELPNITSLVYEDNASSYLVGYIAGSMTKTNKVGFIGGAPGAVDKFEYGFKAGVKAANNNAEVVAEYTNTFGDVELGKNTALKMYDEGVDIIFTAAGACGKGAIEAAKEVNKFAIGVDGDQNELAPENVLTSAMKNTDEAVFHLLKEFTSDDFKGGEVKLNTLEMGGVGIAPSTAINVPEEILNKVDEQSNLLKEGKITPPSTESDYFKFIKELNK